MKIFLILFSFICLYATKANIKYVFSKNMLYVYIQSSHYPRNYKFPDISIENGDIKFLKEFNYFHNGDYFVGRKYLVDFKGDLVIKPLKVVYNSKTYTTKKYIFRAALPDENIYINITSQKSNFLDILIVGVLLYLAILFILYTIKSNKTYKEIGFSENDIKKFYYFLAINGFEEVEILNKYKNVFKKDAKEFKRIADMVVAKLINKRAFFKEFKIFGGILLILLFFRIAG